jgi:hypothetical protein
MHKLLMLAGGLSLCLILVACKTIKRTAPPPFSCEEIEEFVEKNWRFQSEENYFQATPAFNASVEKGELQKCLQDKDTSFVTSLLGSPSRIYEVEIWYYTSAGCNPPKKVCEWLRVGFWSETGKVATVRLSKGTSSN